VLLSLLFSCAPDQDTGGLELQPPEAPVIAIEPAQPLDGDDLVLVIENQPGVRYEVTWSIGEEEVAAGVDVIASEMTARGQTWYVTVKPFRDGVRGQEALTGVTIVNAPPVTDGAWITPEDPDVSDTVYCLPGAYSDEDGDEVALAFVWTVGEQSFEAESIKAPDFALGDLLRCEVTLDDGYDTVSSFSELTVGNAVPGPPEVKLVGATVDDDLQCVLTAEGEDPDGHELSYDIDWFLNAATWTGDAGDTWLVGDTVAAEHTAAGDIWQCVVTPNDGLEDGPSAASAAVQLVDEQAIRHLMGTELVNLGSCAGDDTERITNFGNWGVSWTDQAAATPLTLSIEMSMGLWCSTGKSWVYLNDTYIGAVQHPGSCDCDGTVRTVTLAPSPSLFKVGGENELVFVWNKGTEGLRANPAWGEDVFGVVTLGY
jgi:hypothetical protein